MRQSKNISLDTILPSVFVVRGDKAMLDTDLAALYGVETRQLNQAVKRNIERFPQDFMFQLTQDEYSILKSQNVISRWGGRRTMPYAFTEQGIAMLSSVLKSKAAVEVNIAIIRAFVRMRQLIGETSDLKITIKSLRFEYDEKFEIVFQALDRILAMETGKNRPIGFIWPDIEK
jgi:hypothetical protein